MVRLALFTFHRHIDAVFFGFYRRHFGFQHQIELLADTFGEDFDDVFVSRRNHLIEHFNNVNL